MSDYSPPYTEEDAKLEQRRNKANGKLLKTKLCNLTVEDLLTIQSVYKSGYLPSYQNYVSRIEEILKRVK